MSMKIVDQNRLKELMILLKGAKILYLGFKCEIGLAAT